ncbi:MAG: 2-amino-4-hydroxy-6-hydroxymethyldihydropteridine diphosphokinase [Deltaproteobacteria bacterium]|jgi:2-amino-4-hydroxy-6-hydroxymethyldihydropteridine diphosphokinase|nr:2-amino-4-hydroxy-6-hydroxymethyldihydropteridine diphosphokinase [Deltaproteobacteria bacterium]
MPPPTLWDEPAGPRPEGGILFGANLGDPEESILLAQQALASAADFRFVGQSSLWETEPVGGPPGQPWYLNRLGVYLCPADPVRVVRFLLAVEARLGRVRRERWGPRVIDLDLLYLGDAVSTAEEALVPHPRMSQRAFALYPLAEVRPGWIHPASGLSVEELIGRLPAGSGAQVRRRPS